MRLPTSKKSIVQLSALPVVLCRARRPRYTPGKKRHLPNAYEILVTQYDQFRMGVGHLRRMYHTERVVTSQPLLVSENLSDCRFVWYQNICSASFSFVAIHACDRRMDRQNCDSNTVRCITCSCTVKTPYEFESTIVVLSVTQT